eukprot:scaffold10860_cov182-Amphora_coffeaeformis.AAC.22
MEDNFDNNGIDDDDLFDNPMFDLQASVATMQAEVTQYQKQTQQQQAIIRQLQQEVSQANLQRQKLQEKVQSLQQQQQQQQQATTSSSRTTATSSWAPMAPLPPPQPRESTTMDTTDLPLPQKDDDHHDEALAPSNQGPPSNNTNATDVSTSATTTTSLGMHLCRTVLLSSSPLQLQQQKQRDNHFLQAVIVQKLQPDQDVLLLSFLVEHALAYVNRKLFQSTTQTTEATPLPYLYEALVFCQTRRMTTPPTATTTVPKRKRPLRCRVPNAVAQTVLQQAWESKPRSVLYLGIPPTILEQTFQALVQYAIRLLFSTHDHDDQANEEDVVWIWRLLVLPVAAGVELGGDFRDGLWTWIVQHLSRHITDIPPHAPRRIQLPVSSTITSTRTTTTTALVPVPTVMAALYLGRCRCPLDDTLSTVGDKKPDWFRHVVGVTSDWIHFVLLPCLALYQPRGDDNDHPNASPERQTTTATQETVNYDELVSMACEIVSCWQSWGVDEDWLRTQLRLPTRGETLPSSSHNTSSGRTHATSILQLACRLLQAIALEEEKAETYKALRDKLLRFLGPVVARHPHWLDTSSRLEYTSALAHCKVQSYEGGGGGLAQACWDSARENPGVIS